VLSVVGLYLGLVVAPPDYQQGEAYRIIFVHVPAAWMALMVYGMMAVASVIGLVWRHPLAEIAARAAAPIGATFTAVALFTGSVWGKPIWGAFWVWDARLTSVLILLFLYLGYIALHDAFDDPSRGARAASILCLVGSVNLPIIKFSVEWWNTLHQPSSILRAEGPAVHSSMLAPLLVMFGAFLCYFIVVHILRTRAELTLRKIRNLRLSADPNTCCRSQAPAPSREKHHAGYRP
jgi:heme exporter protein C